MSKSTPVISVVVMARNDNYGDNWVNRINAFLKTWSYFSEKYKKHVEVILVEYNPIVDKKFLHEELRVESHPHFTFRTILVPKEFHTSLPDNEKVPICEFIAKNIGIRRAQADYILAMNPDIVVSEKLFTLITGDSLSKTSFYRVNRFDTSCNFIDQNFTVPKILSHVQKNVIRILYNHKTKYVSWKDWFSTFIHGRTFRIFIRIPLLNPLRKFSLGNKTLHENAAGDFLLAHKNIWHKARGYDQVTVGSGVLDSYILYVLYCYNFKQEIIDAPIYHLYHHHKGVVYLASHKKMRADAKKMLETKIPYKINRKDWGFVNTNFKEIIK